MAVPKNYRKITLDLNNHQVKRIVNGVDGVKVRVNKAQLASKDGKVELVVPNQVANKIERAVKNGKGMDLTLSKTAIKANKSGGFISALAPIVTDIFASDLKRVASADSAGKRKIENRLEHLRGNGQPDEMEGEGVLGDFVDGFKYGFTQPLSSIELLAREADEALSKPSKKDKKVAKKRAAQIKEINKMNIDRAGVSSGGGITFY